jgi:hypothetical protein
MSPTSSYLVDQQRRLQEARQRHFDQRMTTMIHETAETPPALPATTPEPRKAGPMASRLIDIKGLNTKSIADVGAKMAGIRDLVAKVSDSGNRLHAELTDVHEQLEQARTDLKFHAESMGNSGSAGGLSDEDKEAEDALEAVAPPQTAESQSKLPAVSLGLDTAIDEELKNAPKPIMGEGQ